jgi:hypothetical protein
MKMAGKAPAWALPASKEGLCSKSLPAYCGTFEQSVESMLVLQPAITEVSGT